MHVLIDGHNLIPKLPGLNLAQFDDEQKLIERLQIFARVRRQRIEVIFDRAPTGQPRQRSYGTIQVRHARPGLNADEEIRLRLEALGGKAHQCLVVSSDRRVQTYARAARAQVMDAETFARQVLAAMAETNETTSQSGEQVLNADEVEMWMEIFQNRKTGRKP